MSSNRTSRVAGLAALVSFVVAACDGIGSTSPTTVSPSSLEANATVDFVVDGDTIDAVIDGREERVRLIGIDTPETKRPDFPVECYGPEASDFLTETLPVGTPIRIERDAEGRDDFGRLLGYVYRIDQPMFVNLEIVRRGFGEPLSIEPNTTYRELFVEAARDAERNDLGLWSACAS